MRRYFGELLGDVIKVVPAPIRFGDAALEAGDVLEVRMRRFVIPDDQQGKRIWHEPLIPLTGSTLASNVTHVYRGSEFGSQWTRRESGTTGYLGTFVVTQR